MLFSNSPKIESRVKDPWRLGKRSFCFVGRLEDLELVLVFVEFLAVASFRTSNRVIKSMNNLFILVRQKYISIFQTPCPLHLLQNKSQLGAEDRF